jgi:hypothetical protein
MKSEIEHCFLYQLHAVVSVLEHLPNDYFTNHSQYLSAATIGQHCRHAVELMQCLQQGYEAGFVNYDERKRNELIEQDRLICIAAFKACKQMLHWADKPMQLKVVAHLDSDAVVVQTTFLRELAYNLEHLIHHMALMRVGLIEVGFENIPADFGYAYSTIQHQQQCAQ